MISGDVVVEVADETVDIKIFTWWRCPSGRGCEV